MDIVIPYKQSQSKELDYAILGARKHLKGLSDIIIVSETKPSQKGLNWIKSIDNPYSRFKERNIYNKVVAACNDKSVSDTFLFMNDDHFMLEDTDIESFPYYHKGDLCEAIEKNVNNYRKTLRVTRKILLEKGLSTDNYDTHCPMLINKEKFLCTFVDIDWNRDYGYGLKSLYCNLNGIKGEYYPDLKINNKSYDETKNLIEGRKFFSTGTMNNDMLKVLKEIYE